MFEKASSFSSKTKFPVAQLMLCSVHCKGIAETAWIAQEAASRRDTIRENLMVSASKGREKNDEIV
jgi:hypothetical protein